MCLGNVCRDLLLNGNQSASFALMETLWVNSTWLSAADMHRIIWSSVMVCHTKPWSNPMLVYPYIIVFKKVLSKFRYFDSRKYSRIHLQGSLYLGTGRDMLDFEIAFNFVQNTQYERIIGISKSYLVFVSHLYVVCRWCGSKTRLVSSWLAPPIGYQNMALKARFCQSLDENIQLAFAENSLLKEMFITLGTLMTSTSSIITDAKSLDSNLDYFAR